MPSMSGRDPPTYPREKFDYWHTSSKHREVHPLFSVFVYIDQYANYIHGKRCTAMHTDRNSFCVRVGKGNFRRRL